MNEIQSTLKMTKIPCHDYGLGLGLGSGQGLSHEFDTWVMH